MSNKTLSASDKHLLRLCLSGKKADGWTPVSRQVWPVMEELPRDLIELKPYEENGFQNGGFARLTDAGETVVAWM